MRLPGRSLDTIYSDFDQIDKLFIVDQVVDLISQIESITLRKPGHSLSQHFQKPFPSLQPFHGGIDPEFLQLPQVLSARQGTDLKAFLISHIEGWIHHSSSPNSSTTIPLYNQLLTIFNDLNHKGAFLPTSIPIVLQHWDLEPRNVMVQQLGPSNEWRITGIID